MASSDEFEPSRFGVTFADAGDCEYRLVRDRDGRLYLIHRYPTDDPRKMDSWVDVDFGIASEQGHVDDFVRIALGLLTLNGLNEHVLCSGTPLV